MLPRRRNILAKMGMKAEPRKRKHYRIRIDPLDKLFSEFIRRRDGFCQRCWGHRGWKNLQCSHYIKRRFRATRWDEDNCCALCFGCHQYLEERPEEHKEFMIMRLGEQKFDLLLGRSRVNKPDKAGLTLYYQEKIKLLENTQG